MVKQTNKEIDYRGIALLILAIGALYILATNIVATIVLIILVVVILIVGAYFVLPKLGVYFLSSLMGGDKGGD